MKNKNNNQFYTVYGINNSCEILKLKKDKIISVFLLKDGNAIRNDYINQLRIRGAKP